MELRHVDGAFEEILYDRSIGDAVQKARKCLANQLIPIKRSWSAGRLWLYVVVQSVIDFAVFVPSAEAAATVAIRSNWNADEHLIVDGWQCTVDTCGC